MSVGGPEEQALLAQNLIAPSARSPNSLAASSLVRRLASGAEAQLRHQLRRGNPAPPIYME